MAAEGVDFDSPDLAAAMDGLTRAEIDRLPFGVIAINRFGKVLVYNRTEIEQSGYPGPDPVGTSLYQIGRFAGSAFRDRIERARKQGRIDLEIGWFGDFSDPGRALRVRVQSGRGGKIWICIERDPEPQRGAGLQPASPHKGHRGPKTAR